MMGWARTLFALRLDTDRKDRLLDDVVIEADENHVVFVHVCHSSMSKAAKGCTVILRPSGSDGVATQAAPACTLLIQSIQLQVGTFGYE
jgi:hypothetical protein